MKSLTCTSNNWPWRGLGLHPLQLPQWASLVGPRRTRIFRGTLISLVAGLSLIPQSAVASGIEEDLSLRVLNDLKRGDTSKACEGAKILREQDLSNISEINANINHIKLEQIRIRSLYRELDGYKSASGTWDVALLRKLKLAYDVLDERSQQQNLLADLSEERKSIIMTGLSHVEQLLSRCSNEWGLR